MEGWDAARAAGGAGLLLVAFGRRPPAPPEEEEKTKQQLARPPPPQHVHSFLKHTPFGSCHYSSLYAQRRALTLTLTLTLINANSSFRMGLDNFMSAQFIQFIPTVNS